MKFPHFKKISTLLLIGAFFTILISLQPSVFALPKKISISNTKFSVSSEAFKNMGEIPVKYGYEDPANPGGQNISIPLKWKAPQRKLAKIKSYAIVMIDLHPVAKKFVHLAVINIPSTVTNIAEGALSGDQTVTEGADLLLNTYGTPGYGGPNPPPETGSHVYEITVYGLNTESLEVDTNSAYTWSALRKMLQRNTVAKGVLKGKYRIPETQTSPNPDTNSSQNNTASGSSSNLVSATCDDATREKFTIDITASGFQPSSIELKQCTQVTFFNKDTSGHWPASDVHPTHTQYPETGGCIGSKFDACKELKFGDTFIFNFDQKGTWTYHDHFHPSLTGSIVIK